MVLLNGKIIMDDISLANFRTDFLTEKGVFRFVVITEAPERCESQRLDIDAYSGFRAKAPKGFFILCLRAFEYVLDKFNLCVTRRYDYYHKGQLIIATTDLQEGFPMEVCWGGKPGKHDCQWEVFTSLKEALEVVQMIENGEYQKKDEEVI
jgi:hypothetical protein